MNLIKLKNGTPAARFSRFPLATDLFNDFFSTISEFDQNKSQVPAVNIMEDENKYNLEFAVPGMKKEDISINIENDMLIVSGESQTESDEKKNSYTRREFSYNSFNRSFSLPETVDAEKISATYEDGLLNLVLPKKEDAKAKGPREIKVS